MFPRSSIPLSDGSGLDESWFVDPALCTPTPTVRDALADPDAAAAALAVLAPDGDKVEVLLRLPVARLSDTGLVDAVIGIDRQIAALQAKQQEVLAETVCRDPDGERYLREDVACAMKLAPVTAQQRLDVAVALTSRLWDTRELMEAGRLSYTHARLLATATEPLSDAVTAKVQTRVLRRAEGQTPGEFRAAVKRAVAAYDTRDQVERHKVAFADRRVICNPEEDGMASIWLNLAADGAATFMTALNACAATGQITGDERTADQRRADAVVDIALNALADPGLSRQHGLKPAVQVTIPFSTLIGADQAPGHLEGYGPIPSDMALRLANDSTGTWERLITDDAGRLLDYPVKTYKPPAALAKHVIRRDQHCVHPGCRRKAITCQLDHRIPYPAGATSAENLEPLCLRHHLMKHHSNWTVTKNSDGSYDWLSPTKHRYRYRPPELPTPISESGIAGLVPNEDPPPF